MNPEVETNYLWRMRRRSRQHYLGEDLISFIDSLPGEQREECIDSLGNTNLRMQLGHFLKPENDADSTIWEDFCLIVLKAVANGISEGELDLREALLTLQYCSAGCDTKVRRVFMGIACERLVRIVPGQLNARRPPFAEWKKEVAVNLVRLLMDETPQLSTSPSGKGETALTKTRDILRRFNLHTGDGEREVSVSTLHKWLLAANAREGLSRPRGRPRK